MSAKDQIKQLVDYFKREPYLKDKTDAMGEGLMLGASLADESNERSKEATATTKAIQEKYKEQILAQDLNPNKDPELVDLRNGNSTAGERITKFEQETTAQFQQTDQDLISRSINLKKPPVPFASVKADGTDETELIQSIIDYAYENRETDSNARFNVFAPGGNFLARFIRLPKNCNFFGGGRDNTTLKQVLGETEDFISDNPETGAFSIRVYNMRLDGQGNDSNGLVFGFNPADDGEYEFSKVWGVEGRIESVMVRNFKKTGFKVKGSVSSMEDVIAINCGTAYHLAGGSGTINHLIAHDCNRYIEFAGSAYKVFGAHYETNSSKTDPIINYLSKSTDNIIHHLSVQAPATGVSFLDLIRIDSEAFGNGVESLNIQGIPVTSIDKVINDRMSGSVIKNKISSYVQNVRKPIRFIRDADLVDNTYRFYQEAAETIYIYDGTNQYTQFTLPKVGNAGMKLELVNESAYRLRINPHETDVGKQVFYGLENVVYVAPKSSVVFISDGNKFVVQQNKGAYPTNQGIANIAVGVSEVTVTHNLGTGPSKVFVTPKGDVGYCWISDITGGQFKINCSKPPGTTTPISWLAEI